MSSLENAPDLVAVDILASSIDGVVELLDELYPDIMLGHAADDTVQNLMLMLSECRTAIDDYRDLRTGDRPGDHACWLLDDDIF